MLSEIQGAAGLTKDFFGFLNWVKDIAGSDIISAYFRYDGNKRIKGSASLIQMLQRVVSPHS